MLGRFFEEGFGTTRAWPLSAVVMLAFMIGLASMGCVSSNHTHSGEDIKSGKVSEARIDDSIARDKEINSGKATYTVFGPWLTDNQTAYPAQQAFIGTTVKNELQSERQPVVGLTPSSLPSSLNGKSMLLTGVELCYDTREEEAKLNYVELSTYSTTDAISETTKSVVRDDSPPDGNVCHMFSGTPQLMGTNSHAHLRMSVLLGGQTSFYIRRTTFFLEPSDTPAAPLYAH